MIRSATSGVRAGRPAWVLPFEVCPAVPAAVWLGLGILGVAGPFLWGWSITVLPVSAALTVALAFRTPAGWRWLAGLFPLGLGLTWLHVAVPWQTYVRLLPRQECWAEVQAVVTDANYTGDALDWVDPPARVMARLHAVRFAESEAWQPCSGRVLLRLRRPAEDLPYGTAITAAGTFVRPPAAGLPGELDYRRHLRNEGVRHMFLVQELTGMAGVRGWRTVPAVAYAWRDRCAERLSAHVTAPVSRDVLLAITWGYRQGLDPEVRARFLRSGAMHLFAISGQHVAILASIALLFSRLACVPFCLRHLFLPLLLGGYVFLTGGAPSAVRAWLMLSLWSAGKASLRPQLALNAVALAAVVVMVCNPLCLGQPGFQFSFLIVTVLILGCRTAAALPAVLGERDLWLPPARRQRRWQRGAWRWAVQAGVIGVLAWFGSAGLVAWTNSLFIPGSILVNAGICCLAWFTLLAAVLKVVCWPLLLGLTVVPDRLLGAALDGLLAGIDALAAVGAGPPASLAIVRPAAWVVWLYHGLLAYALFRAGQGRSRALAAAGLCGMLLVVALRPPATARGAVFAGGANVAPVVIPCTADAVAPVVIHAGDYTQGRMAAAWLTHAGWNTIDALVLPGADATSTAGIESILAGVQARTLVLPARPPYGAAVQRALRRPSGSSVRIRPLSGPPPDAAASDAPAMAVTGDLRVVVRGQRADRDIQVRRGCTERPVAVRVTAAATGEVRIEHTGGCGDGRPQVLCLQPSLRYTWVEIR